MIVTGVETYLGSFILFPASGGLTIVIMHVVLIVELVQVEFLFAVHIKL
jgi:hypothetical protein